MIRSMHKLVVPLFLMAAIFLPASVHSAAPNAIGEPSNTQRYQLHDVNADMSTEKYRQTYRKNQGNLRRFVKDFSESGLVSLGIPRRGIQFLGAVAAAAVTQDATLYLNSSKFLALEVKDAADEDRAVYLGVKVRW